VVRFHTIYWPAFLMSARLALPKRFSATASSLTVARRMSKSLGNVVDPVALAEAFGVDQLRYFLMREVALRRGRQL
jgi:methionyl-tRNA synthetase